MIQVMPPSLRSGGLEEEVGEACLPPSAQNAAVIPPSTRRPITLPP
jgi:hypothetical protein